MMIIQDCVFGLVFLFGIASAAIVKDRVDFPILLPDEKNVPILVPNEKNVPTTESGILPVTPIDVENYTLSDVTDIFDVIKMNISEAVIPSMIQVEHLLTNFQDVISSIFGVSLGDIRSSNKNETSETKIEEKNENNQTVNENRDSSFSFKLNLTIGPFEVDPSQTVLFNVSDKNTQEKISLVESTVNNQTKSKNSILESQKISTNDDTSVDNKKNLHKNSFSNNFEKISNETLESMKIIRNELIEINKDIKKHRNRLQKDYEEAEYFIDSKYYLPLLINYFDNLSQQLESLANFSAQVPSLREQNKIKKESPTVNLTTSSTGKCDLPLGCLEANTRSTTQSSSTGVVTAIQGIGAPGCSIQVRCDQKIQDGGWTVVLHRQKQDPQLEFARTLDEYISGFGDVADGELWIGLDNLHYLTKDRPHHLRIDMAIGDKETATSYYSNFKVGRPTDGYRLEVFGFDSDRSTGGDSLTYHNNQRFTTVDADRDGADGGNCAEWSGGGGWWYKHCYFSNPTGRYPGDNINSTVESDYYLEWRKWQGYHAYLTSFTMRIRPTQG